MAVGKNVYLSIVVLILKYRDNTIINWRRVRLVVYIICSAEVTDDRFDAQKIKYCLAIGY